MDVASYIREYLFKQDFLDIPGLGTFFLTKEPFSIQDSDQVIKPGSKTLIFRENAGISNDTLSYFIARRAGLSVDEARDMVNNFVSPIRGLFPGKGSMEIPGLGKFMVPDGFHLDFKPYPFNFAPSSFGLGSVSLAQSDEFPTEERLVQQAQPVQEEASPAPQKPLIPAAPETSGIPSTPIIPAAPEVYKKPEPVENDGHLPTAEEIYARYHFVKEVPAPGTASEKIPEESQPDSESLLSGSSFSELPSFSFLPDEATTYPTTLAFSDNIPVPADADPDNQAHHGHQAEHEPETAPDLVYNPLAYDSSAGVPGTGRTFFNERDSTAENHGHDTDQTDNLKPEPPDENSTIYWVLGGLLLICMLAALAWFEQAPIKRALFQAGIIDTVRTGKLPVITKSDSLHTAAAPDTSKAGTPATGRSEAGNTAGGTATGNASTGKTETQAKSDSLKPAKSLEITSHADTGMTTIQQAPAYLLIDASVHLLQTAKRQQSQLQAKGIRSEIIDMGKGVLMRYKVSLGGYSDKKSASDALSVSKIAGGRGAQVFENKSKN